VFSGQEYRTTCNNNFLNTVDGLDSKSSDGDKTHTALCCGFNVWNGCTKKMVVRECGKDAHESFTNFVGQAFGTLPNMACPMDLFAPKSDTCAAVPVRTGKKVRKGHNTLTKYLTSHLSFLFVLN